MAGQGLLQIHMPTPHHRIFLRRSKIIKPTNLFLSQRAKSRHLQSRKRLKAAQSRLFFTYQGKAAITQAEQSSAASSLPQGCVDISPARAGTPSIIVRMSALKPSSASSLAH
jgi:hypothetical protein